MDKPGNENGSVRKAESPLGPIWKPNLYRIQQSAPKPNAIKCYNLAQHQPTNYGCEFHGAINHNQTSKLLLADGDYLVRLSSQENSITTLSMRFRSKIKHYRLYYDGQHYVMSNKKFDSVYDLVADGLVILQMECEAGPYIQLMYEEAKYEKSPGYLTLTRLKKNKQPIKEENINYEKNHNFKTHKFKGLNWCEFCGNFLWGFTAQGVKCEDCGFSAHFKCSEKVPADCCPELKQIRNIFGVDLTTLVRAHQTVRPFVVDKCIEEIEARGLCTEGLYRVSGFADEMDALRTALEKDGAKADISAANYDNINVVAGILKLYFRLLPIPLITFDAYPEILKAAQKLELSEQLSGLEAAVKLLPLAHFNTLKFLMAHLSKVVSCQVINKMSAQNLSTVFAPTLMPVSYIKLSSIPDMSNEITALCLLIQYEQRIFS